MGTHQFKKPEPSTVRGICVQCKTNQQKGMGGGRFKPICSPCDKRRTGRGYTKHKKLVCEECGFKALHACQLDVDHADGDHFNDHPDNLKTLCANCHRLKTWLAGDNKQKSPGD